MHFCVPNVLFLTYVVTLVASRENGCRVPNCPLFGGFTGLEVVSHVRGWRVILYVYIWVPLKVSA